MPPGWGRPGRLGLRASGHELTKVPPTLDDACDQRPCPGAAASETLGREEATSVNLSQHIDSWISGYPDVPTRRLLHRIPVLLWRLGLQRPIGGTFVILTSTGRRSGQPVHTPVMPHRVDGSVYVWCPYGDRGQWCRNVQADPVVTVQDANGTWAARATRPDDAGELARVHARLLDFDPGLLHRYLESQGVGASAEDFVAHQDRLHVFRLAPTSAPSPAALRADLVWVWALAPIVAALAAANRVARGRCRRTA
jgi:deazaflavin-dependent oxidoreductase (nitroreductase family)